MLSPLDPAHHARLSDLVRATPEFSAAEMEVAMELVDAALARDPSYQVMVDVESDLLRGYVCWGKTAMTRATYDLYWIAVARAARGAGVGRGLMRAVEATIQRDGARLVRVETEGSAAYEPTRAFYESLGYQRLSVVEHFYDEGNALVTYGKYF